jgi:hypothetical protein
LRGIARQLTLHGVSRYLSRMVRRRHVYHVAGYDPIDAGAQYRRFRRQLDIFQRTWNVAATLSEHSNDQSSRRTRATPAFFSFPSWRWLCSRSADGCSRTS